MNDMKIIMEGWRSHLILTEQMEFEKFFEDVDQLDEGLMDLGQMMKVIYKTQRDNRLLGRLVVTLYDKVIVPARKEILTQLEAFKLVYTGQKLDDQSTSIIGKTIDLLASGIKKMEKYLKSFRDGTWKKAIAAMGLAVSFGYLAYKKLRVAAEFGAESLVEYFKNDLMKHAAELLGDNATEMVTTAFTGGTGAVVKVLIKLAGKAADAAEVLKPAFDEFLSSNRTSLTRVRESLI